MKRGIRISLILVIGVILAAAGLIGLWRTPGMIQYTFRPGEETTAVLLENLDSMRESLGGSFPVITLHAQKSGESISYTDGISQNDVCLYAFYWIPIVQDIPIFRTLDQDQSHYIT